jgi:hypothetical protein
MTSRLKWVVVIVLGVVLFVPLLAAGGALACMGLSYVCHLLIRILSLVIYWLDSGWILLWGPVCIWLWYEWKKARAMTRP